MFSPKSWSTIVIQLHWSLHELHILHLKINLQLHSLQPTVLVSDRDTSVWGKKKLIVILADISNLTEYCNEMILVTCYLVHSIANNIPYFIKSLPFWSWKVTIIDIYTLVLHTYIHRNTHTHTHTDAFLHKFTIEYYYNKAQWFLEASQHLK